MGRAGALTLLRVLVAVLAGVALPAQAAAPPADPVAFVRWLDGLYYSQARAGLRDLAVRVAVEPLWDFLAKRGSPPEATYYWKQPGREALVVTVTPPLSPEAQQRLERLLLRRGLLVDQPVEMELERFTFSLRRDGALYVLAARPRDARSPIASRQTYVDAGGRIVRVVVTQDDGDVSDRTLDLVTLDGKLAVRGYTGTLRTPQGTLVASGRTTRIRVAGVWLASEVTSRVADRTTTFRFSDHRVNRGVPDGVFR